MYHLLTNCSQSILPAMVCRLKPIGLQAQQSVVMQSNESFVKSVVLNDHPWWKLLKGFLWDVAMLTLYRLEARCHHQRPV